MRPPIRYALALGLSLLVAAAAHATHWTAVAATGAVDESAAAIYAFTGPALEYLPASASTAAIVATYNVTNTSGQEIAPWNTLELGYFDNAAGSWVQARLIQVKPCTGTQTVLCSVTSVDAAGPTCNTCTFGTPADFGNYVYYVEVTLRRTSANLRPQALALRLY